MRRPKVVRGVAFDSETSSNPQPNVNQPMTGRAAEQIITSDDILASMGDAYLDKLSSLEGLTSTSRFVRKFCSH